MAISSRILGLLILFIASNRAQACTCAGIQGIGEALTRADAVIVARVLRQLPSNYERSDLMYRDPMAFQVTKSLKGNLSGEVAVSTLFMCYRSFDLDDFKPGETYVLPLFQEPSGMFLLPSCSHSALKLQDGRLYKSEFVTGGGRRLEDYMSLRLMEFLLPLGVLSTTVQIAASAVLCLVVLTILPLRLRRSQKVGPREAFAALTLRSKLAVGCLVACSAFALWFARRDANVGSGIAGMAFMFAAAGVALRWRWAEGFTYAISLFVIAICVYFLSFGIRELVHPTPGFAVQPMSLILPLAVIACTLWCADSVRRRFSANPRALESSTRTAP